MKKILIIIFCIWAAMFITGLALDRQYKIYWRPVFEKFDGVFKDSTGRDIVLEGDSRVHLGINPYYIDSVTGLNSFNSGLGGASVDEMYLLTRSWLKNHRVPKLFVVSINYAGMRANRKLLENPCYYLFYSSDPLVSDLLDSAHFHTALFRLFPMLKYTVFDEYNKVSIIRSLKGDRFLLPGGISYKGFFNNAAGTSFRDDPNASYIDTPNTTRASFETGLNKFGQLLEMIHSSGSRCFIVYPPCYNYKRIHNNIPLCDYLDEKIAGFAGNYNDPVIHYDTDSSFTPGCFQDPWHLNIFGSVIYSKKMSEDIKRIFPDIVQK